MTTQPPYGAERFTLVNSYSGGTTPYAIRREVFVEGPPSHKYDEASRDFITWRGQWVLVETVGFFASRDEARDFMIARTTEVTA